MDMDVLCAKLDGVEQIINLSSRVQATLTTSGSQQEIGPLSQDMVKQAVSGCHCYVFEKFSRHIGCVLVRPLTQVNPTLLKAWRLNCLPEPYWLLHSLILEPMEQGKRARSSYPGTSDSTD